MKKTKRVNWKGRAAELQHQVYISERRERYFKDELEKERVRCETLSKTVKSLVVDTRAVDAMKLVHQEIKRDFWRAMEELRLHAEKMKQEAKAP